MIAKLPLVPFEIINLTRLTVGVCMKVRFKSKVTRGFSLSHRFATRLRRFAAISRLKKNLWDQGKMPKEIISIFCVNSVAHIEQKFSWLAKLCVVL